MFKFDFANTASSAPPSAEPDLPTPPDHKELEEVQAVADLSSASCRWEDVQLNAHTCIRKRVLPSNEIEAPYADQLQRSDLVPGVYEGGFKLWECAVDLAAFVSALSSSELQPGSRVLELGCGHGLPGIVALMRGASVDFVDYNIEVIRQLTIPNVIANLAAASGFAGGGVDGADGAVGCARFFGGDWNRLAAVAPPDGYDLILSADTLYNTQTASELAQLVQNYHKRPAGLSLIAAKRYYFGVGGGTNAFTAALTSGGAGGAGRLSASKTSK